MVKKKKVKKKKEKKASSKKAGLEEEEEDVGALCSPGVPFMKISSGIFWPFFT